MYSKRIKICKSSLCWQPYYILEETLINSDLLVELERKTSKSNQYNDTFFVN